MTITDYRTSLRASVRGLWAGQTTPDGAIHAMVLAVERGLTQAWYEGARSCGIRPDELTIEETTRLRQEVNREIGYIIQFVNDVSSKTRADSSLLKDLYFRLEMWVSKYDSVRDLSKTYACGDKKLKWLMNPIKEHCGSCLRLHGRVYRASIWKKYNIYPRMPSLQCRGYRCGCGFAATDDRVTPGRPPSI